jgi:hypothetical protein
MVLTILLAGLAVQNCDLTAIKGGRAVHEALSRRAVGIMAAAATSGSASDNVLNALIDKDAVLTVIVGDVGLPGKGAADARSLAKRMNADEYRFLGWDYMDIPDDACRRQQVTVDFIANREKRISRINFTFENGHLMGAEGWQHLFAKGPFP